MGFGGSCTGWMCWSASGRWRRGGDRGRRHDYGCGLSLDAVDVGEKGRVAAEPLAQLWPMLAEDGKAEAGLGFGFEGLPELAGEVSAFVEDEGGVHEVEEVEDDDGGVIGVGMVAAVGVVALADAGRERLVELVEAAGEVEVHGGIDLAVMADDGEDDADSGEDEAAEGGVLEPQAMGHEAISAGGNGCERR